MKYSAPKINNSFVCIVDGDQPELAAIISSYFSIPGVYFAIFEFPGVTAKKQKFDTDNMDSNTFSLLRASHYGTFLNNILARMKDLENVILAGLSTDQKTFISRYDAINYLEINTLSEVDFILSPFLETSRQKLRCRSSELLEGLFMASLKGHILEIDEFADEIELTNINNCGLVVIENENKSRTVAAVNYAFAVGADINIVEALKTHEEDYVQQLLQDWEREVTGSYELIQEMVNSRVNNIVFSNYLWATFFTQGLPYSLIIKNIIPCSYVCIHYNPDFFIMQVILFEQMHFQGGAGVFSPLFFEDEETKFVADFLNHHNYFVKAVIGPQATVFNLDMHLKEFPYDVFHICSHGGEIKGNLIAETFYDRYGKQHVVEYENVMSVTAGRKEDFVKLQRDVFLKKLDGYKWGSKELRDKYSSEIFTDMHNAMRINSASEKKILRHDVTVANSCHIQCSDGTYQGIMETLAAHSSPFIFNNTCSSWYNIAVRFLGAGSKGYIGTLCRVNTVDAANYAKAFYISANRENLMIAAFKARAILRNNPSENIYIFWGLHFSSLSSLPNKYIAKRHVFIRLTDSLRHWFAMYSSVEKEKTKEIVHELLQWTRKELLINWTKEEKEGYFKK